MWLQSRSKVVVLASILVVLAVMLAACEYPGVPHPRAGQATGESQPIPSPEVPEPPASPNEELPPESSTQERPVEITLKDCKLEPGQVAVKADKVTVGITNDWSAHHDIRV